MTAPGRQAVGRDGRGNRPRKKNPAEFQILGPASFPRILRKRVDGSRDFARPTRGPRRSEERVEARKSSRFFKRPRERQRSGKKGRADIGVENVGGTFDAVFFSTFFSAVEKQHHGDAGATVFALANRFPGGQASLWPGDTDCQSICPSRWSLIRQQC